MLLVPAALASRICAGIIGVADIAEHEITDSFAAGDKSRLALDIFHE